MLNAVGSIMLRTKEGLNSTLAYARPTLVQFSSEVDILEASGFPAGDSANRIAILDSEVVKETWTLQLDQESIDEMDLERILDARQQTITSIVVPDTKVITIPAGAPSEYTLTELSSTAADQDISVVILSDTAPYSLKRVLASATPAAGEFTSEAAKVLQFNAAEVGKQAIVYYPVTMSNLKAIGGTALRAPWGNMEFFGIISGTRVNKKIWCPSISRISGANLGVSAELNPASLQYRINTPTGYNFPMLIWNTAA